MTLNLDSPPLDLSGYDPTRVVAGCTWDPVSAIKAVSFFPDCLSHVKGFSGRFELLPWQEAWIATLFGWRRPDGTRRYRECLCAVPRKNGKTSVLSGLALYLLLAGGSTSPEVYSAAFSRDQAALIFDHSVAMVRQDAGLSSIFHVMPSTKRIVDKVGNGFFRAIPAEVASSHGFNASAVLFDELHTQKNRELYDALKTSQGARARAAEEAGRGGPMFVSITTAGWDRHSICWEVWDYARRVRDGIIPDPYFLPVIYETGIDEDWIDRDIWRKVNPSLGASISMDYLEEAFARAQSIAAQENTFRNLHLNQWVEQSCKWIRMDAWDRAADDLPDLSGCECWAGLDLSTTTDLSALAMVFPLPDGRMAVLPKFWCPADSARQRSLRDHVPYEVWTRERWITSTPGVSVDYDRVRADIAKLGEQYNIRSIAIDRWNANQLAHQLQDDGFNIVFFGQGYASMSSPSKEFERRVAESSLLHGGNPVLRWMTSNLSVEQDAAGNIKPSKAKSMERIDGIVATIMGLGVYAADAGRGAWSVSELGL